MKVAECFLEEDETVEADGAVTKAGTVVESITNPEQHMPLILRYKSTYARVLDANRKFLQASSRYHDLSQSATDVIDADDLLIMLGRAATCAILAPSGNQRQRILALVSIPADKNKTCWRRHTSHTLYPQQVCKDTRLSQLDLIPSFETHAVIVRKMYTNQIIRPEELVKFGESLADHQKAIMGDGLTIMERAVIEHNMVAVSKLFVSIYMTELGKILGVKADKAEKVAADMIMDGSLNGSIDQVDGLLEFVEEESQQSIWDRSIASFCTGLNQATEGLTPRFQPQTN